MSTYARDLASNMLAKVSVPPQVATADISSPTACNMITGDGLCCLTVTLGTVHADTTGVVQVEESDTGTGSWSSISGASVSFDGTEDNTVKRTVFQRSKQYLRSTVDLSGGTLSAGIACVIEEQLKQL